MTAPTVARTTGGTYDPAAPNLAFLAGGMHDAEVSGNRHTLIAVNEISSAKQRDRLDRLCDERSILLDSGVYALAAAHSRAHDCSIGEAFATAPEEMDGWAALYDSWCDLATRFADRLWGVIELDQGGAEAATATRARITRDTGVVPIPVYHPLSDGWDYYDTLAAGHDRICVGGLAGRIPPSVRLRLCWTAAQRARVYPHLWTHLLGVTPSPMVASLGLRGSTDSSAWLSSIRWSSNWKAKALLAGLDLMPVGMTYRRDDPSHPSHGRPKAMRQSAASARFQQVVVAALADDTHPHPEVHP